MISFSLNFQLSEGTQKEVDEIKKIEGNEKAKEIIIASLYANGLLKQKQARLLINNSRREFQDILEKYGFPASGYLDEETFNKLVDSNNTL